MFSKGGEVNFWPLSFCETLLFWISFFWFILFFSELMHWPLDGRPGTIWIWFQSRDHVPVGRPPNRNGSGRSYPGSSITLYVNPFYGHYREPWWNKTYSPSANLVQDLCVPHLRCLEYPWLATFCQPQLQLLSLWAWQGDLEGYL